MTWSPFAPEILNDPANGHHTLLSECPVHKCEAFDPPFYTLSRYADVEEALRDIETYSSQYGQGPRFSDPQGMLCDPPQHTQLRRIVQQAFTPKKMAELRPRVEQLTDALLTQAQGAGHTFDLHDDFAFPLPVIIIAGMLGVPESDLERFKYWSDVQVAAMGSEDPSQYADIQTEFMTYLLDHLKGRQEDVAAAKEVPDDLLTVIAEARYPNGELVAQADALSMLSQLLVGGNETTTSLITNMIWRLLETRDLWEAVIADPTLIEAAVEESLRFDPPVLGLYRNTTRDLNIHSTDIPENSKVLINYAAANRDDTIFTDPDRFDLHRERKRHMSFGLGTHFCLGAPMARMEAEIALAGLIKHMPDLQLVSSGERITPFFLWGRSKLPVRWK